MRVDEHRMVRAPRDAVWALVGDPPRYLEFFSGLTQWDVTGEQTTGCGARFTMHMQVGSAPVGGLVEIVEFDEPGDLAWTSVTGLSHRGRWRLRERTPGRTDVTL